MSEAKLPNEDIGRFRKCLKIFLSMLYISAFTFGGGFVIVSLMKKRFVDEYGWLSESETLDMIALSQSAPGPIAVNAAILFGWRLSGFWGMASAVLGTVIPPVVIISAVYFVYDAFRENAYVARFMRGMQAGVAAVLASVVTGLTKNVAKKKSVLSWCILLGAFLVSLLVPGSTVYVILASALIGVIYALLARKGDKPA